MHCCCCLPRWRRFAQKESHFNLNSGLFYVAANVRTIELMERLESRLARQKYWDQTAYNEEIFFLSHDTYRSPKVCARVCACVDGWWRAGGIGCL